MREATLANPAVGQFRSSAVTSNSPPKTDILRSLVVDGGTEQFVAELVKTAPEVQAIYRDHISQQGELLPHVLMADISRAVISAAVAGQLSEWVISLLQHLDAALVSGVPEIAELVGVSFVENLCGEDGAIAVLKPRMGLALRRELRTICGM